MLLWPKGSKMQQTQQKKSEPTATESAVNRCNRQLSFYLRRKGMPISTIEPFFQTTGYHLAISCRAATKLAPDYDVGIGIAWGGAPLSFIFENHGLPIRLASAKRKGAGVSWRPIDELNEEAIEGKRVLVMEIDVLVGRTLRRAVAEIEKLKPRSIDLLLEKCYTFIPVSDYRKFFRSGGIWDAIPPLDKAFENTARVIKRKYPGIKSVTFEGEEIVVEGENGKKVAGTVLLADLKCNVPKEFGKIITVDEDFSFYDGAKSVRDPLNKFEAKMQAASKSKGPIPHEWVESLKIHYLSTLDAKLRGRGSSPN
jgi:hypothetical protein